MRIGVLAVQGAFIEHIEMIEQISKEYNYPIECVEVRKKEDLEKLDGIILPGGESTVQGKLIREIGIFTKLQKMINAGVHILATCAGLILLAQSIENDSVQHLATMPITVKRNAYGRQLGSYIVSSDIGEIKDFPFVFIRAPYVTSTSSEVAILATIDSKIVAVEYKNQIGLAFHPEMTNDTRIHKKFIDRIRLEGNL